MIVAPLIFGGIVTGIAGHGELRGVGRVALKAIIFFEVVTTLGLFLGAVAIDLTQAGVGVVLPAARRRLRRIAHEAGWQQMSPEIFPENIAQAVAQNQILQVAVFALLFGAALATLPEHARAAGHSAAVAHRDHVPHDEDHHGVGAGGSGRGAGLHRGQHGIGTLLPLAKLAVTCYATLVIFVLCVFVPILMLARVPVGRFAAAVAEPAAIGFATTSSEAALPLAMERMEEFGVPRWIVSFVIPTGYSFNLTGSTLYLCHGGAVCRAGGRTAPERGAADGAAGHAGAHQQRHRRRAARDAGGADGRGWLVSDSCGGGADAAGRGHADGHGPNRD